VVSPEARGRRRLLSRWGLAVLLGLPVLLGACALRPDAASDGPYHAFELGVAKDAGTLLHLRWHYGDIVSWQKPAVVGNGIPFVLRRQPMPVPEFFEASWQEADGRWFLARVPVRPRLKATVEGHSVLFMVTAAGVTGALVTYTPRGDQNEVFAQVSAQAVGQAEAAAIGLPSD